MKIKSVLLTLSATLVMSVSTACAPNNTDASPAEMLPPSVTTDKSQTSSVSETSVVPKTTDVTVSFDDIPAYSGQPSIEVNKNKPYFEDDLIKAARDAVQNGTTLFENSNEQYAPLDKHSRCQTATCLLSIETMPSDNEEREGISMIQPAGWHTVKYPDVIEDLYLYNRCHLISWQLGGENANEQNITTGTRYMNVEGMLPLENKTAEYIKSTQHHVLYRATPVFVDDELICRGIRIEAMSIEDDDLSFCIYCYNVQPYIHIDYTTGDNYQIDIAIDNSDAKSVYDGDKLPKDDLSVYNEYTETNTKG